jgi:hypothetical protein
MSYQIEIKTYTAEKEERKNRNPQKTPKSVGKPLTMEVLLLSDIHTCILTWQTQSSEMKQNINSRIANLNIDRSPNVVTPLLTRITLFENLYSFDPTDSSFAASLAGAVQVSLSLENFIGASQAAAFQSAFSAAFDAAQDHPAPSSQPPLPEGGLPAAPTRAPRAFGSNKWTLAEHNAFINGYARFAGQSRIWKRILETYSILGRFNRVQLKDRYRTLVSSGKNQLLDQEPLVP